MIQDLFIFIYLTSDSLERPFTRGSVARSQRMGRNTLYQLPRSIKTDNVSPLLCPSPRQIQLL